MTYNGDSAPEGEPCIVLGQYVLTSCSALRIDGLLEKRQVSQVMLRAARGTRGPRYPRWFRGGADYATSPKLPSIQLYAGVGSVV